MKIPDGYKTFSGFEEKRKKYYEWDFKNRKKNELKVLYYKGVYTDNPYEDPEPCGIIGYYNDIRIIIELSRSKEKVIIDRRYLKQMQNKNFRQNQVEDDTLIRKNIPQRTLDSIDIPESYVVYDLETTGFSAYRNEIIEIAALKIENGEIVDTFQSLVKPSSIISREIERLTGITNSMLSSAPDLEPVLHNFISFIGSNVLVGHNIKSFDNNFIAAAYYKYYKSYGLHNNCIDTLELSETIYPDLYSYKLSNLVTCMGIPQTESYHRALADCHYTQKVLEHIINDIENQTATLVTKGTKPAPKKKRTERANSSDSPDNSNTFYYQKHDDLRKLTTQKTEFDTNHPFYGKCCVFTGELEKYSREEAAQFIVDLGGKCENNVTKRTNFLILSNSSDRNGKSTKQKKAEEYKLKGCDIDIISENVFYDMIGSDRP